MSYGAPQPPSPQGLPFNQPRQGPAWARCQHCNGAEFQNSRGQTGNALRVCIACGAEQSLDYLVSGLRIAHPRDQLAPPAWLRFAGIGGVLIAIVGILAMIVDSALS